MFTHIIKRNNYLNHETEAFFHADYLGGGNWKVPGTIENIVCTLKNDITPQPDSSLRDASQKLANFLMEDLPQIRKCLLQKVSGKLTVCVIPRAKVDYRDNQILFKRTVCDVVNRLCDSGFANGTGYIVRTKDTKTTHLKWGVSNGGTGSFPYPGITKETCSISSEVKGKDILLIDDIYTVTVNIDEDAIQALYDMGAKSVFFYSVGKTIPKSFN